MLLNFSADNAQEVANLLPSTVVSYVFSETFVEYQTLAGGGRASCLNSPDTSWWHWGLIHHT